MPTIQRKRREGSIIQRHTPSRHQHIVADITSTFRISATLTAHNMKEHYPVLWRHIAATQPLCVHDNGIRALMLTIDTLLSHENHTCHTSVQEDHPPADHLPKVACAVARSSSAKTLQYRR